MKKCIRISSLVLIFLTFLMSSMNATKNPTFNFSGNRTLIVEINDWQSSDLTLEILDLNGKSIYSDLIHPEVEESKEYNLEYLQIGEYYLILYGGGRKSINSLSVKLSDIELTPEAQSKIFEPHIDIKRNRISLNYMAFNENVRVTIIGKHGVAISTSFSNEVNLTKKMNISNLASGNYVMILDSRSQNLELSFNK